MQPSCTCLRSPFKSSSDLASRLCKAAMLHRFKLVARGAQREDLLATSSYREAKVTSCRPYSLSFIPLAHSFIVLFQNELFRFFCHGGLPHWVGKGGAASWAHTPVDPPHRRPSVDSLPWVAVLSYGALGTYHFFRCTVLPINTFSVLGANKAQSFSVNRTECFDVQRA